MAQAITSTMGLDLGDRRSHFFVLDPASGEVEEGTVSMTRASLGGFFEARSAMRVVLEAGGQSAWVAEVARSHGHETVVAQSGKVRVIYAAKDKSDRHDAERLARLGSFDTTLLAPIRHRGLGVQRDLALLRTRDALVGARTKLVNTARTLVKVFGERLPSCSVRALPRRSREEVAAGVLEAVEPLLRSIEAMTGEIEALDRKVEHLCSERYPETERLRQVPGVGALTALAFVLTVEDPGRFARSRSVGAYFGLTPARAQSGALDRQLGITKAGNGYLRRLLVQGAQYMTGPFGADTDFKRWAERKCSEGGSRSKKRAVVGVARRLAVLLHRLWVSGEAYEPLRHHGE